MSTILDLAKAASERELEMAYGKADTPKGYEEQARRFEQTRKILEALLRRGSNPDVPAIPLKEAVFAADFKILFPKVVQGALQMPKEGSYIGQSLLARTINVEGARVMEFPTLGAVRAFELSDTQEPPDQDPSFSRNMTEIRVRRFGLKLAVSNDVIEESQWDVLGLYIRAAGDALARLKEELIFNEYETRAVVVFDNEQSDSKFHTTGVSGDGVTKNGTFDHMDLLDMMASLGANGYSPTHIVLHPMAWSIWAKDPFLRYQLIHQGGVGQTVGSFSQQGADLQAYVPFGLQVVVSPHQTFARKTLTGGITAPGAGNYTTITVVDSRSSILILQRTAPSMSRWEDPVRDILNMAFHEKYGLALLNGGRSAVVAKNVRVDLNHKPIYTIRTVNVG